MRKKKISITIPKHLYEKIEKDRKKFGLSRSPYITMRLMRKRRKK